MELARHPNDVLDPVVFRHRLVDEVIITGFLKCALKVIESRAGGILDAPPARLVAASALDMLAGVQTVFQCGQTGDNLENGAGRIAFLCGSEQQG